jgi:hypothetical protein
MTIYDPKSPPTVEALTAENNRLRARLDELEAELSDRNDSETRPRRARSRRSGSRHLSDETEDLLRDLPSHSIDEIDRLARGLTYALEENIRSMADVVSALADRIFSQPTERYRRGSYRSSQARRHQEDDRDDSRERESTITADDLAAGIADSVHESLAAPGRVIRRFWEAYETDEEENRSTSARRRGRTDRSDITGHTARGSDSLPRTDQESQL